ncbi:hypothetical protein C8P64_2233 [Christiangramia gaetbulicola]|uniref:Uncharacterized protein n=1 Tax=Christiangramia gaetbulicola TaxID=703340 RepID=A0A2T6AIS3_9FLAO|nr:hypothetical protein [Christiangramia gaetbulicola]PTX43701.1 hypothetical protein C8P64_2233 [Christiangramia gaetbulicola]
MDEILFYSVVVASVIIVAGIWIRLQLDNTRQEKLIKKYLADLSILKRNRTKQIH